MEESKRRHLVKEYEQLWQSHGVSSLKGKASSRKASAGASSKKSPAPPREAAPPPPNAAPAKLQSLEEVQKWLGDCRRCQLCKTRNSIVFGTGNPKARLVFVGEGPGADEDMKGLPFVGRAGKLLDKIIEAMGYERKDVYIANVVKCRPPNNRTPLPEEVEQCFPFLRAQLDLLRPQVVVGLGLSAATALVGRVASMGSLRGRFHALHWNPAIQVMPTYHPAYLLRNPPAKRFVWADMKLVKAALESVH